MPVGRSKSTVVTSLLLFLYAFTAEHGAMALNTSACVEYCGTHNCTYSVGNLVVENQTDTSLPEVMSWFKAKHGSDCPFAHL